MHALASQEVGISLSDGDRVGDEISELHRWALTPVSVISDIGLSLISELPISD